MEDNYREVKKAEPCLKLIHMDQVEVEEIEWLFYPFIPYGKVTIIQGDPGEGKTTVVLQIIAKLTKGEAILSETSEGKSEETGVEPINVIYQTAEDGLGDTIKPRLLAAGADCSRVLVIDDQDQPLTMVDARLEEAIIQTKAVELLMKLWNDGKVPTCLEVLKSIRDTGLFKVGNRVDEVLADYSQDENEKITALRTALSAPFYELERYALYVSDNTRFATHQGVKGLEFPRVMVILDDAQARGFLFSYEKLFGVKAQSDTDEKNAHDGKDTSITRTARLFYVACTRAKKSLAIVAYTENEEMVRDTALANGWFLENEIYIV